MNTAQKLAWIEKSRNVAKALLEFEELNDQYVKQGLSSEMTDDDFTDINDGITMTEMIALYGTPWTAVNELLQTAGVKTVLYTVASV